MRISVIGLGKLGLPFVYFLASHRHRVMCYDINKSIYDVLKKNRSPYIEPLLEKSIKKYKNKIQLVENIRKLVEETNITFLVLPTPSKKDGSFSNIHILKVLRVIGKNLVKKKNKKHLIVITSTVMPNSCQKVFIPYLENNFGLINNRDFIITYNPHFIAQGTTFYNLNNPDILLLGSNSTGGRKVLTKLYKKIYKSKKFFKHLNLIEAEITKLSVNSFVTNKITFSNLISTLCENVIGANASLILDSIGQDRRIGKSYMKVGTRFSGPCFPRDNKALVAFSKSVKSNYNFLSYVDKLNNEQTFRLIKKIKLIIKSSKKRPNIGVLGVTYKKDTNIIYDSQGYELIKKLANSNIKYHKLYAFDPYVKNYKEIKKFHSTYICKSMDDLVKLSDIVFIMYKDNHFMGIKKIKTSKKKVIIDCWDQIKKISYPYKLYTLGRSYKNS